MAVHHGKNGKVKITDDLVADVTGFSVTETIPVTDTTAMGSAAATHLVGIPSWTANVDLNYNPTDTDGQAVLLIGASVTVGFYTDGDGTGKKYMTGTATVTSVGRTSSHTEKVTASVGLTGNGALSHSTVT